MRILPLGLLVLGLMLGCKHSESGGDSGVMSAPVGETLETCLQKAPAGEKNACINQYAKTIEDCKKTGTSGQSEEVQHCCVVIQNKGVKTDNDSCRKAVDPKYKPAPSDSGPWCC
jgi:hypothetical protein